MSDRWGRPTIRDWAGMTNAFAHIGANNRANKDRADREKLKGETRNVFATLSGGGDASKLGVSVGGLTQGRALYADDLGNRDLIKQSKDNEEIKTFTNGHLSKLAEAEDKISYLKTLNPQTLNEQKAIAGVTAGMIQDKTMGLQLQKLSMQEGTVQFKKFNDTLIAGKGDIKNGNNDAAELKLVTAIKESHHPTFLEKNPNGTYDLHYREGGVDKLIGDDISLDQAYSKTLAITPQEFVTDYVAQRKMWAQKNNESASRPEYWSNGQDTIQVSTLYNQDNPIDGILVVYDQNGKRMDDGSGMAMEELRSLGFMPENLGRDKEMSGIESEKALARERNAKGAYYESGKIGRGAGGDLKLSEVNSTISSYRKSTSDILAKYETLDSGNPIKSLEKLARDGDPSAEADLQEYASGVREIKRLDGIRRGMTGGGALGGGKNTEAGAGMGNIDELGSKGEKPQSLKKEGSGSTIINAFNTMLNRGGGDPVESLDGLDISQLKKLSQTQGKDAYGRPMEYPASESLMTKAQKFMGQTQSPGNKFGQGPIESILEKSGIEADLAKQKEIAAKLKSKYPNASEKQIAAAISKRVGDRKNKPDVIADRKDKPADKKTIAKAARIVGGKIGKDGTIAIPKDVAKHIDEFMQDLEAAGIHFEIEVDKNNNATMRVKA